MSDEIENRYSLIYEYKSKPSVTINNVVSEKPKTRNQLKHPTQPIYLDESGIIRFKENKIINYLFNTGKLDLCDVAAMNFPSEDRIQIAQLLGYSESDLGELRYVSDREWEKAMNDNQVQRNLILNKVKKGK